MQRYIQLNKGPSWHSILLYHHSHHHYNVTAPHGRPNLRSRLHCCHAQEEGPRSPQGHVVALDTNIYIQLTFRHHESYI